MNRAMLSGVAGMKSHQTKMDVIGNNISNVNTYGYKSQRAVFSDMFYQTLRTASEGTANRGGTNPSTLGYGSSLQAIQTQMSQSSMQNTGFGMDVAILGEGFLQVMDADGNIFYTKAGLLDYDARGYLTDINGNFVLGSAGADGVPGTQKIKLDNIGAVEPKRATVQEQINNVDYTITASNSNAAGNVGMSIGSSQALPAGVKATAIISSGGTISVQLNAYETFASMGELSDAINAAITEANGGKQHKAGVFNISASEDKIAGAGGLTGAEIAGANFGTKFGKIDGWEKGAFGGMTFDKVSSGFSGSGTVDPKGSGFQAKYTTVDGKDCWEITMTIDGKKYTGQINEKTESGSILLKNSADDYIQVTNPGFKAMNSFYSNENAGAAPAVGDTMDAFGAGSTAGDFTVTPSTKSKDLGLSTVNPFLLKGGTEGGPVTLDELASISIGSDGTVFVSHSEKGTVVAGRISLATFANPSGLQQTGSNYYQTTVNSGDPKFNDPGTGGTGGLKSSALEMSNVDLSEEFSDMITTQRGFQANSRVITVSDTMLEELINLKR